MLKKAGIVVAAAAACALSVSPLAFAGSYSGDNNKSDHKSHHKSHHKSNDRDTCRQDNSADGSFRGGEDSKSLLNFTGNAVNVVPINACNDQILSQNVFDVLLGKARGDFNND